MALAVNAADVATPEELVVAVFTPPAKVPEAPLLGAVNITDIPLTPLPPEFFTVTTSAPVNAVLTAALCGVPLVAAMEAGPLPAWLVSLKRAVCDTPDTFAVTV